MIPARLILERRADATLDAPRLVAVLAVVLSVAVHAAVAWGSLTPVFALDEVVMVGNAKVASGVGPTWQLRGAGFMPGLGMVLAPLWWLLGEAPLVYAAGVWIAAALGVATVWPLARIVTRFGATPTTSVVIAALITIAPSRALLSNYLLSESLMLFMLCWMVVAAMRWLDSPRAARSLLFGASVAGVVLAHGRGVAVAVAMGVWVLMRVRRDWWAPPLVAATSGALLSVVAFVMYRWCSSQLFATDPRVSGTFGLASDASPLDVAGVAAGQLWYLTLAWPLVGVLGMAALLHRVRRDPLAGLLVLVAAAMLALSVYQFTPPFGPDRLDGWFYGRYVDPAWAVISAIGLAYAVRVRWPVVTASTVGVTGAVGGAMMALTAPHVDVDEFWVSVHVLGVEPWLSLEAYADSVPQNWLWLAWLPTLLCALLGTLAFVRWWLLPVLGALWTGLTITTDLSDVDVLAGDRSYVADPYHMSDLPPEARIGADPELGQDLNMLAFYSGSRSIAWVEGRDAPASVDVFYAPFRVTSPEEHGARRLAGTESEHVVGWVMPGPVQDELARDGQLVEAP